MKNNEFRTNIILSTIKKGYNSFEEILSKVYGIYPSELRYELERLVDKGEIFISNNQYFYNNNNLHKVLPLPHPLDYDWRFSRETLLNISNHIYKNTIQNNTILLLGAPSVFLELVNFLSNRTVVLIDQNISVISELNKKELPQNFYVFQFDIFSNSNNLTNLIKEHLNIDFFDYIFFDPPWYLNYYKMFFYQSYFLSKVGTIIQLSLFPVCVRPLSYEERWELFDYCNKLGFSIISLINNSINYETPVFEKNSLINDNSKTTYNWRFADLLTLIKTNNIVLTKDIISQISQKNNKEKWISYIFNDKIIKIKQNENDKRNPELISIIENDILKTVSKRNKLRDKVDLWFWDNRVFSIKGSFYFNIALSILTNNETDINIHKEEDKKNISIALNILKDLISK